MHDQSFSVLSKADTLKHLAADILAQAKARGATQAEVCTSITAGFDVKVRLGETDTVSFNRDHHLAIDVYYDQKKGSASSSDLSAKSVAAAVNVACDMAQLTQKDSFSGLADAEYMAYDYPDLDLYHAWDIDPEAAILIAKECEDYARDFDKKITNSEGANVSTHQGYYVYANSHGFMGAYPSANHSLSCTVIGTDQHDMQRDYWYTVARNAHALQSTKIVGETAAQQTLKRLGARRLKTQKTPVIFAAKVASSLLSHFLAAISGGSLYRQASFLCDHLHKPLFPAFVHIHEQPHLINGLGSSPFDEEGSRTQAKDFVTDGVLQSYILSSYSARKLKLPPTGNAGGVHNLFIDSHDLSLENLFKEMGRGLYVTELIGDGINLLTGDYSRGAVGFWVEHGEIQYPVHEITIAGNLREMFAGFKAVGNDVDTRRNVVTGSIWLDSIMVAGE